MIPSYKETLETKEILSLDYIPLVLAQILHNRSMKTELSIAERFANNCEAIGLLEEANQLRPHFFLSSLFLCLLYYSMGCPLESLRFYSKSILDHSLIHSFAHSLIHYLTISLTHSQTFSKSRTFK